MYFETEFNNDIEDGTYYLLIAPPETQEQFRHLYLPPPDGESGENGSGEEGGDSSTPSPVPFDPSRLIDQAESDNNTDGGSTPIAGIVSGVCVGIVAIGIGLFVYKKRYYNDDDWSSKDSSYKKEFDPENDLEGGNASGRSGSEYSSRDEFSSSGHSQSSSSMQSYSDSDRSSRSSRSTDTGSYSSRSNSYTTGSSFTSSKTGTEDGAGGPASVSASESDSYSSASASAKEKNPTPFQKDENLDENRNRATASTAATAATAASSEIDSHSTSTRGSRSSRGSKSTSASDPYRANVDLMDQDISKGSKASSKSSRSSRATPTDDDSSAGSSGWDSSDGESSVDTGSVDSYDPNTIRTGDLDSSKASSYPSSSSSEISPYEQHDNRVNPAVNPVVQHG